MGTEGTEAKGREMVRGVRIETRRGRRGEGGRKKEDGDRQEEIKEGASREERGRKRGKDQG